jgi:acyl-homoserine lactone acylase PvdQ
VPIRAKGVDPNKPIPGNTSATEWQGLHRFEDLVQIENPTSGYMHNCNVTPFGMMKDSPLTPEKYSATPYIYNATRTAPRHQRAEMMTELLDSATQVTLDKAIDIAFSPRVYHAELWQAKLKEAWSKASAEAKKGESAEVYDLISKWNRRSEAGSEGALAYYAFKKALGGATSGMTEPPGNLTDDQLVSAVSKAAEWLKTNFGSVHTPYGKYFRVGRRGGDRTFPVGGGSLNGGANNVGMATPRAISFQPVGKEMVGVGGQTSTQIVILTNPPKSYAIIPLGESDHKESGHWDDQAEKLFSKSIAAPTYFMDRNELMKHVTSRKVLKRAAASQAVR